MKTCVGKLVAVVLWTLLVAAAGTVIIMTWHPWVPWGGVGDVR
jgi:hypothetical protein